MTIDKVFLDKLIETGSPTGREQELQRYILEWAKPFVDEITVDMLGNLAIIINPEQSLRVMLAAHCDRIGFIIMNITKEGMLRVDPLGGVDEGTMQGAKVTVHAEQGDINGVIGKVSTHLQDKASKDETPSVDSVWIDIGAKDKEEADRIVKIGDYISYELHSLELMGNRIAAPGLDNMLGLYTILQVAKRCKEEEIAVTLYCVSTVQEELGARGAKSAATSIKPHIAIAVDTTLASDTPGKLKKITVPSIHLGAGPSLALGPNTSPAVLRYLRKAAEKSGIAYQLEPNAKPEGNDAKEMQLAASGTASASLGIPLRNMHTQIETADLNDMEAAIELLTMFLKDLSPDTDLLPINHSIEGKKIGNNIKKGGL